MNNTAVRAHPYSPVRSNAGLIGLVFASSLLSYTLWTFFPDIDDENHLLEWLQALFLALACYTHGKQAWRLDRNTLGFAMHAGLAVLMYAFLLRELDIDQFGQSHAWKWVERFFRLTEAIVAVRFLIYFGPRVRKVMAFLPLIFSLRLTMITICGGLFMVAGWPFDKEVFHSLPLVYSKLFEEMLELNGYLLLFVAALTGTGLASMIEIAPGVKLEAPLKQN